MELQRCISTGEPSPSKNLAIRHWIAQAAATVLMNRFRISVMFNLYKRVKQQPV